MAKFTINWMEEKETKVGPKYNATVSDERGVEIKDVTLWPRDWPNVMNGQTIEADLVPPKDPKYGPSLYPAKTYKRFESKTSGAVTAAKITSESVKEAQERKNESISYFNSLNSAIAILGPLNEQRELITPAEYQAELLKWRDILLDEWRKYEAADYKTKRDAF